MLGHDQAGQTSSMPMHSFQRGHHSDKKEGNTLRSHRFDDIVYDSETAHVIVLLHVQGDREACGAALQVLISQAHSA